MRIHLLNGDVIESTTISEWPEPAQATFFRTVSSGQVTELRFEAEVNGEIRWVFIRVDRIQFISFSAQEMDLSVSLLNPASEIKQQTEEV